MQQKNQFLYIGSGKNHTVIDLTLKNVLVILG